MKNKATNDNQKPSKEAKLKVRVKRSPGEKLSEKERKATLKVLSGEFGRMDRYDESRNTQ